MSGVYLICYSFVGLNVKVFATSVASDSFWPWGLWQSRHHCFQFPHLFASVLEPDAMIFVFWMLSFRPAFSLSSFTYIKRLFSSSSLSAMRVLSSAYLRLLIFLPKILIPDCASSSLSFLMMYSAFKSNKQGDIYSLDVLLFLFRTSLLFHVQF